MRKLSKKISMLMVLAMLVSLFSGIVSASAAAPSSWSFKSSKYDVAVGETIEMEKNEYADFDLFRYDAAPEGYTVKWSSSDSDAVWVNAKTGQLRADKFKTADLGDKATISATFTNTKTGKSATRSFVIVVAEKAEYTLTTNVGEAVLGAEALAVGTEYALTSTVTANGKAVAATVAYTVDGAAVTALKFDAAGEYTVVATATVDGKVVAEVKTAVVAEVVKAEFVKAVQKSLNTVVLTLSNAADAEKLVTSNSLLAAEYYVNDLTVSTPIKSITAVKDDAKSVEVVLYNNIIKDLQHKFIYGDANIAIVGTSSDPVRIEVIGAAYEYQTEKDLVVKVYNAQNVDITADIDLASKLTWEADATEDFYIAAGKIFFYNENKTAKVTAVLDMGLNENYEEIQDLKATGYYTSVKTADVRYAPHGYQAVAVGSAQPTSNYSTNAIKLAVNDAPKSVAIIYKYKAGVNNAADRYIYNGTDSADSSLDYTYYSSNKSVVMVDEDNGELTAVAPGSTTIYVKCKNINTNAESTICTIPVTVYAKRALTSFTVRLDGNNKLSVTDGANAVAPIKYAFTAKDQLGDEYETNLGFRYEITYPAGIKANNLGVYLTGTPDLDGNKISIDQGTGLQAYLTGLTNKQYETIKIKVVGIDRGNNNKEFNAGEFTILARNVAGVATQSRELTFSQTAVDMKLNKDNLGSYVSNLTLAKKDNQGFYLGDENINVVTNNVDADVVSGSGYWVVLKKDGQALTVDGTKVVASANKIAYNTVYDVDGVAGGEVKKMDKGVYSAELYVFNTTTEKPQYLGQRTLSLTDSTEAYTVKVIKDEIDVTSLAEIKKAIEFYRGGSKIDNGKITDLVWIDFQNDGDHTYVTSLCVKIGTDEMNWKFGGTYTEQMFNVNALFDTK